MQDDCPTGLVTAFSELLKLALDFIGPLETRSDAAAASYTSRADADSVSDTDFGALERAFGAGSTTVSRW